MLNPPSSGCGSTRGPLCAMKTDAAKVVGSREKGRLCLAPETETFPYTYTNMRRDHEHHP